MRYLIFIETSNIVVDLESYMFVRVIFINKLNVTNMLSNAKVHFYIKNKSDKYDVKF